MNKYIVLIIITTLVGMVGFSQADLERIIVESSGAKIEVKVPKGYFKEATGSHLTVLDTHAPLMAISYDKSKVLFTCTQTDHAVDDNGIPAYTDKLIAIVKDKFSGPKIIEDGILLQDGKNIGFIKFQSKVDDLKRYNYVFYLSVGNQLLQFMFSCPKSLRKKWENRAEEVAASIRILP